MVNGVSTKVDLKEQDKVFPDDAVKINKRIF